MSADIKNVVKALEDDVNQLPNDSSESEVTKDQALARIQKEVGIINAVEKRNFDEKLQRDEYELKKDHTYAQDNLEKDRFNHEKERDKKNDELNKLKLEYEKDRIKFEQENIKIQNDIRRDNMKFQLISVCVTAGLGLLGFIANMIGLAVSDRAHKRVMTMIYLDEGRSTTELKDSVKRLDNFIKKY